MLKSNNFTAVMYHGTAEVIKAFDPDRTGQGEDQYGSGFYFDSHKNHAEYYAHKSFNDLRGNTPNVVCAEITLQNPIVVDGTEPTLECVEVTDKQAYDILNQIPGFFNPNIAENPLGDYISNIWSHPPKSKYDFRRYISWLVAEFYHETNIRQLDFLCAKWPTEFRTAVKNVTGYDGVLIQYPHSQQVVAWFPEQIKILSSSKC